MTITPTPLLPAPPAGTTSAAAGNGKGEQQAAAAGFGALLAQLAAAALPTGKASGQPGTPTGNGAAAGTDLLEGDGSEESAAAGELPLTASADPAAVVLVDPKVAPTGGQPALVIAPAEPSLAETAVRGVASAPGNAVEVPTAQPADGHSPTGLPGGAVPEIAVEVSASVQPDAGVTGGLPTSLAAGTESGEVLNSPAQSPGQLGVVAGSAPSTPTAGAAGATAAAPGVTASPLLDQVTPVVSRLVSAGEGSHRMVLRLHPADLGEVQLTVTVRGESVDVTVAAGTEAREMLAGGSSELRALLDSIGRTAGQITFRELPGAGQLQQPPMGLPTGGQPDAGQAGTSYGDLAGGSDGERDGRGGSGRARANAPREQRAEPNAPRGNNTSGTPGSGALDVRI